MSSRFEVVLSKVPEVSFSRVVFDDGQLLMQGGRSDGTIAVEIQFPSIHFLSASDEGSRLRLFIDLDGVRGAILRMHGDLAMTRFMEESRGTLESLELMHFVIMLGEEIFDVISGYEPEVRWPGS